MARTEGERVGAWLWLEFENRAVADAVVKLANEKLKRGEKARRRYRSVSVPMGASWAVLDAAEKLGAKLPEKWCMAVRDPTFDKELTCKKR